MYYINNDFIYRPDFFIFDENDKLIQIIEIKGYWKNKTWKFDKLKLLLPEIECILITDVNVYTINYNKDLKEWKKLRKLKLKE